MANVLELLIELMANSLELRSMALLLRSMAILHTLLHGHEPRRPWLCCSADVHHAEYGEPLEQTGALELCERRFLWVRARAMLERDEMAVERADGCEWFG